jgi:tetratricopeptide (TPR) repeat protein
VAVLLVACLFALAACGSRRTTPAPPAEARQLTPEARASYDYLVYQDQLQRLQRHMSLGKRSALTPEEVRAITERAEQALDRLLAAAPSPQLYLEKAGLHWNDPGGPARARTTLKEGLKKYPDDRLLTIYLANSYLMDNRADAAIGVMDDYLSRHGDDFEATERLGQLLMDAGQDAQALDVLKRIPAGKRSPDALYSMGRVQGNLGMRKAAIANLSKAVKMDPAFTEAMVELAYQYELSKDYVAAERIYTRILKDDSFPEARLRLINLNLKLNNPDRAMQVALEGPHTKAFILDAALMFINDGFYAQGSTVLDMLAAGGQVPAEFYFYKAVIANEGEKDAAKAMDYLAKVGKDDRLYPHALRFEAQILHAQGRTDRALAIAAEGRKRYPDAAIFYILQSALLKSEKDLAGAEKAIREGLDRLKGNPELSFELAMLLDDTGRREEGLALMEGVLRTHPDDANALNYVGYTLAEEDRELERALVLVQKASALEPESGFILDSVAWVHYKMKDYGKAWENIKYAVDMVEDDPTIWEHYGDIARALGKKKEARKGYNYSLKYRSKHPEKVRKKLKEL